MDESEQALWRADCLPDYYRLPIRQVLDDCARYHSWEINHALLMRQVARAGEPLGQAFSLRQTTLRMIHRRGLFDYLRTHHVRGCARERLLEIFYGPMDFRTAVLCEHRQFVMAASSGYCGEVLVDSIHDRHGLSMLERYEDMYCDYFEVFARFVTSEVTGDRELVSVLRPAMLTQRARTDRLRAQILSLGHDKPFSGHSGARPQLAVVTQYAAAH